MSNTERVQIIQSSSDLMSNYFGSLLSDCELSSLKVSEQVTPTEIFHYNVDIVLVFKDVEESNYVWMLAHLENLDLSPL